MTAVLRRFASSAFVHLFIAFVGMGGWAFYTNRRYPMPQPLVSGLVQGMLSALLTLFLKSAIDFLARRFTGATAYWAPPLIACLVSATILTVIHTLGGTPRIVRTIAIPLLVSTSYATLYNYSLIRRGGGMR
jgi:Na+/serine symporter